uniref:(northern house mosquito) hypothetical protein n=1 Tax=Culex pipiens TaxID=7175 RepID=A0A8D8CCJ1_CULPI
MKLMRINFIFPENRPEFVPGTYSDPELLSRTKDCKRCLSRFVMDIKGGLRIRQLPDREVFEVVGDGTSAQQGFLFERLDGHSSAQRRRDLVRTLQRCVAEQI